MVGKMIHLLFRQDFQRAGLTLVAPHATFDGAKNHLQEIEDYCEKHGLPYKRDADGSLTTSDLGGGEMRWYYFVSSRTILD